MNFRQKRRRAKAVVRHLLMLRALLPLNLTFLSYLTSAAVANCSLAQNELGNKSWIVYSGATDHMTFDPRYFIEKSQPRRRCISNANGVTYPVTGAGKVALESSLALSNTLRVPALSNKLLSVGQATEELNSCALIYPQFCFF